MQCRHLKDVMSAGEDPMADRNEYEQSVGNLIRTRAEKSKVDRLSEAEKQAVLKWLSRKKDDQRQQTPRELIAELQAEIDEFTEGEL